MNMGKMFLLHENYARCLKEEKIIMSANMLNNKIKLQNGFPAALFLRGIVLEIFHIGEIQEVNNG